MGDEKRVKSDGIIPRREALSPESPVGRKKLHVHYVVNLRRELSILLTINFNDIKPEIPMPLSHHEPVRARPKQIRLLPAVNRPKPPGIG